MKPFFAFLLLVVGVCVACSRSTSSQTPQESVSVPVPSPTQAAKVVSDQAPCSMVMHQAPVLHGLKLQMTPQQVLALFPGSSEDAALRAALAKPPSKFGVGSFALKPDRYQSKEEFKEVLHISFTLLDGLVSSFSVGYNGPAWPDVDKFVEKFTTGTNLPTADSWEAYPGLETQMKTLTCRDFGIQIFSGGEGGNLNYVLMRDLVADKTLKERRAKAKEKAAP